MRRIIAIFSTLLFVSGVSKAQGSRPIPPASEALFSSSSDPAFAGTVSIATPPISLEGANLGFDVTIFNPNSRPILCRNTLLTAYMAPIEDRCEPSDYVTPIDVSEGKGYFEVPANGEFTAKYIGNKEREKRARTIGKDLEFCRREPLDLSCGFSCSNGKKYDETWDEVITGGSRKYRCEATGEPKRTSDPVSCDPGYIADPAAANDRCLKTCDGNRIAGDTWEDKIDFGKVAYSCLTSGQISYQTICQENPRYAASEKTCVPASCSGTSHGVRGNKSDIPYGTVDYICENGGWVNPEITCNAGAIKENASCRPGNVCAGNVQHNANTTTRWPKQCPSSCEQTLSLYQCNDGTLTFLRSNPVACMPLRGGSCR